MMRWNRLWLLGAVTLLAGAWTLATLPSQISQAAVRSSKDRKQAPSFQLKDADGQLAKLEDYKGRVVLLNFFATWCGPCKVEIPWFGEFDSKYRDKGFAVVGVSMDDDGWSVIKPFLAQNKVKYRTLLGTDPMAQLYGGIDSLPTTFLIDRSGRIASVHIGLVSKSEYQTEIDTLLRDSSTEPRKGN